MRLFYIRLIHHGVLQRCVYALVPQKLLYLLDGHPLIDCHCCERPSKFVRMDPTQVQLLSELMQPDLDAANLQSVVGTLQRDKERGVIICPAVQIVLQVNLRSGVKIHLALLVSLSENYALAVCEINIVTIKKYQFTDAHPRGCQQINQRQIPAIFTMVAHDLQCLVGVSFFDCFACLHLMDPAHGTFYDIVLILKPSKKA